MHRSGVIVHAKVKRVRNGYGLVAQMQIVDALEKRRVVEAARQSVIRVVEGLRYARVVNIEGNAFTETTEGFSIELGGVRDDALACWDIYARGRCPRGVRCPWQHPTCKQGFEFAVMSVEPSVVA